LLAATRLLKTYPSSVIFKVLEALPKVYSLNAPFLKTYLDQELLKQQTMQSLQEVVEKEKSETDKHTQVEGLNKVREDFVPGKGKSVKSKLDGL
jgi:hypothetical protein